MELQIDKSNWEKVTLGDVIYEPKETTKDLIKDGFNHIVGLEHIDSEDIHLRKSFANDVATTFTKVFRNGDVLFGRRRAYLKKAAQANFDGVCSGDITVLRANEKVDNQLLPFIIQNDAFFDYAVKHSAGGLSPRVKFKDIANYEFLLPPLDQQVELAELLWAMDEVIEKDIKVLERFKTLYSSTISKKLLQKDGILFKLNDNAKIIRGVSFKPENLTEKGVIILRSNNIRDSKINLDDIIHLSENNVEEKKLLKENDFAICMSNGSKELVGKSAIISKMLVENIAVGAFCAGLRTKKEHVNLIKHLFNSESYKIMIHRILSGSTINNLKSSDIEGLSFLINTNFKEICTELDSLLLVTNITEEKIQHSKNLLKALINDIF